MLQKWLRALWLSIADFFDEALIFPTSQDRRNDQICDAINARRPIAFYYRGGERTAEPFCLGLVHRGGRRNVSLLCYQTGGYAELAAEGGWKLYRAREIEDLAVGREEFVGDRPGYDPDTIPMYRVYCRVVPTRRWRGPAARSIEELVHGTLDEAPGEQVPPSHDELMHLFRRMHPDLDDAGGPAGTLPEDAGPAPRKVTPAPGKHSGEKPSG